MMQDQKSLYSTCSCIEGWAVAPGFGMSESQAAGSTQLNASTVLILLRV